MTRASLTIIVLSLFSASAAADLVPTYQVMESDAFWTKQSNGEYTVPTSAENYSKEQWERPIKDNEWSDGGGTRTTHINTGSASGEYYGYADLKGGKWGVGTYMSMDYLFVQWDVVGGFFDNGSVDDGAGFKGQYYFYAEAASSGGGDAFALWITDGNALGSSYGTGKVTILSEQNTDVPGNGIMDTQEGGDSFLAGASDKALGRKDTTDFTLEVAVKLSDIGLTLSDFNDPSNPLQYAYIGAAVSNPSDPGTGLFANDHYPEAIGSGQEYDTLRFQTLAIPEPSAFLFVGLVGAVCCLAKRLRSRVS